MPHATVAPPGLQALILCGPGVSLNTFTSNPKDLPKALVPIANRPMVWYPLDWCHRMGVTDITLISPPESAAPLEAALATNPSLTSLPSPKPEILAPPNLTQTTGTGEILRLPEVQKCITNDFIVLPCDLISELEGSKILQEWMTINPLATSSDSGKRKGAMSVFYPTQGLEGISAKKDETDFIATVPISTPPVPPSQGSLRSNIEEVVINMPTDTLNDIIEENKGFFRLRQSLLDKHGRVKMKMKHRDAHIYIFPKWVKQYAAMNDRFDSISEDLLGWWAKARWQTGLVEKLSLTEILRDKRSSLSEDSGSFQADEIDPYSLSSTKASKAAQASIASFASRVGTEALKPTEPTTIPQILAYVQPTPAQSSPQPLIRRVDTSAQLLTISLHLAKQAPEHVLAHEHKIHPTAQLEQQARVSQEDSLVAENVKLGFRSNIKESVVGANCDIGKNVRLTRCLLMEGVFVGDGVQMTGCIVGRRARIEGMKPPEPHTSATGAEGAVASAKQKTKKDGDDEERTKLTECEIAPNFIVEAGTEAKGEKLMAFETDDLDDEMNDDEDDE